MVFEYAISAIKDIISLMIILGTMTGFVKQAYDKKGRLIFKISTWVGIAAALWMAIMKNATNMINTSALNLRLYYIGAVVFILFIVFLIIEGVVRKKGKLKFTLSDIALGAYNALLLFITLPDFIAYPYSLKVSETTVFSSSYILKLSGVLIGFALTLVLAFASDRIARRLGKKGALVMLIVMMAIIQVQQLGSVIASMITNRVINGGQGLFDFAVFILNHDSLFRYLSMACAVCGAVAVLIKSLHVNEPYSNSAEHRKIRAKWRKSKKWSFSAIICVGLSVFMLTFVNSVVNAEVELSPTEDSVVKGDSVVVTFDRVNDGKLHRFGYKTKSGKEVRYIVIKKPNSNLYGVGMDCCDICGETGYYQNRSGDVVCSRCNVIMNINTIGFKGGCNPKVVDYKIKNNSIIIPIKQLTQYEKDFKS